MKKCYLLILFSFLVIHGYAQLPKMRYGDITRVGVPYSKDPHVVKFNGKYLMYHSLPPRNWDKDSGWIIGIAESRDLLNWVKIGEITPQAGEEYEKKGMCAPGALVKDGKVHLFYQTYGNGEKDAICHAVSDDGINFKRNPTNPIFSPTGDWTCGRAIDAEVYEFKGQYFLYFATRDKDFKLQMQGVAVAPGNTDFKRGDWVQATNKPILSPELPWEGECVEGASIVEKDGKLVMFYAGAYNNKPQQIGVAESTDGINWKRLSNEPFLANGKPGEWNSSESGHPHIFEDSDGRTYLFYQGNNDMGKTWLLTQQEVLWEQGKPVLVQDYYGKHRADWLKKAEASKPQLVVTEKKPTGLVNVVKDDKAFQGWRVEEKAPVTSLYRASFKETKEVIIDFGEHITGYFAFSLALLRSTPDAPLRFKLTFAEVPSELVTPFDPFSGGLSRAWLQDEVVTVMNIPEVVRIDRRMAFRYVKIELLASSPGFDFAITDMTCKAVTSASQTPEKLADTTPKIFQDIDRISLNTLRECMQTVYEDGPKRDRRLWLGDLYLEALANTYSFKQHDLTKRCLYLLAALAEEDGLLNVTVFEEPTPHPQKRQLLLDYSFLFSVCLKDYLLATNDRETVEDLWPVAIKQLESIHKYLQKDGLMDYARASKEWWIFFDWKDGLHKEVALQGVSIFALREAYALAKLLNREKEVASYPALIKKMTNAARKHYYNKQTGVFAGLLDKQVSYASQVWMVLAEVPTIQEGKQALLALDTWPDVCTPGGPYMYHYYIEALLKSGLTDEARGKVAGYWGKMVEKGADTFWEVYDPKNEFTSPYNFYPINSYCHAWSCTPTYFIRKYPEVFQK